MENCPPCLFYLEFSILLMHKPLTNQNTAFLYERNYGKLSRLRADRIIYITFSLRPARRLLITKQVWFGHFGFGPAVNAVINAYFFWLNLKSTLVTTQTCIISHRRIDLLIIPASNKCHHKLHFASVARRLTESPEGDS